MKTYAFGIEKGGVGKTSMSVAVGSCMAKHGAKVLLLDLDTQGQASFWTSMKSDGSSDARCELADVLYGRAKLQDAACKTFRNGMFCLPTFGNGGLLREYTEGKGMQNPGFLLPLLDEAGKAGYDYSIMDLSPGFGPAERAALLAADEVITPLIPSALSVDSLSIFDADMARLQENFKMMHKTAEYKRMIINAFNKSLSYHKEFLAGVKKESKQETYVVPQDQAFVRASRLHCMLELAQARHDTLDAINEIAGALE
jgi:chromosome partitioning protein